jgi:hypothetical protein
VAVLDSGLNAINGEFDDVNIINLNNPGNPVIENDVNSSRGHGTRVCGVIAADNDGQGINGLASLFLKEYLTLMVGMAETEFEFEVMVDRAINAGVDVINISNIFTDPSAIDIWYQIISDNPDVFFVVIAWLTPSGERIELIFPPAGFGLPNMITVGGYEPCSLSVMPGLDELITSLIEIRAPAENVPVVAITDGHRVNLARGTSFAAPQVASLVAILKAINPNLSGQELKGYLRQYPLLTPGTLNYRLVFDYSIAKLLSDMGAGSPVSDWINPVDRSGSFPSGLLFSNVCGKFVFTVSGEQNYGAGLNNIGGNISGNHSQLHIDMGEENDIRVRFQADMPFRLGAYAIVDHGGISTIEVDTGLGDGISGNVSFDSCRITERHPATNEPVSIAMSGNFYGVLRDGRVTRDFEGYFTDIAFTMYPTGEDDELIRYYETNCQGGI